MKSKVFTFTMIVVLGIGSFAITTRSQVNVVKQSSPVQRTLKVKKINIDSLLSKIDTIQLEQEHTKQVLIENSVSIDRNIKYLRDIKQFVKDSVLPKEEKAPDTVFIEKVVIKEKIEKIIDPIDSATVHIEKDAKTGFFKKVFKFLPSKKK